MKILKDIPYTVPADAVRTMDVYLPRTPGKNLFLYIHGGGLEAGDKAEGQLLASHLAQQGITAVSINYRMYPAAHYPDFIRDAALAIRYVKEHMAAWGAQRLYVGGSSAGGYISMMLCFDPQYLQEAGLGNGDIAGYFHDAGQPTAHFRVLRERGIDPRRVIVDETCALYHIGTAPDYPPMHFVVSDRDLVNRYEQTLLTLSTLRHFGFQKADLTVMQGEHCAYITRADENGESVLGRMIARFIAENEELHAL